MSSFDTSWYLTVNLKCFVLFWFLRASFENLLFLKIFKIRALVSSHLRHFVFAPLSVKVSTFQSIEEVLVKTGISGWSLFPGRTILPFKIMINKFKSSFRCKLSLSVSVNIIPSWVLLVILRICLNILDQSDQSIAVYLENIFEKLTFLKI